MGIFPEARKYGSYPWQVWAIGWFAVFRGFVWMFADPGFPDPAHRILGFKYLICIIPYVVLGIGIWNLKKWAAYGLVALSAADLVFSLLAKPSLFPFVTSEYFLVNLIFAVVSGPTGAVLILLTTAFVRKFMEDDRLLRTPE